jgi:hypothetical protein
MSSQRLVPFDASVAPSIDLSVTVDRRGSDLQVFYRLTGAVETIALPSFEVWDSVAFARRMGLWEMTCFEFFLGVPGREDYWEVNLSPAGYWNVFRLDGYRSGLREEQGIKGLRMVSGFESGFCLQTVVDLNGLGIGDCEIELSVTAVIAEVSGAMSYWALCHGGREADFHLRDSFVMALGI